jgi:hypothetical protein
MVPCCLRDLHAEQVAGLGIMNPAGPTGAKAMASKTEMEPRPRPTSSNRDLAYRSSQDVSGPLTVILAVIAFVLAASFLYNLDMALNADYSTVSQTVPSPTINPNLTPDPATPPETDSSNS